MNNIAKGVASLSSTTASYVLLVDDEHDILPEYQEFFEGLGFATLTCSDPVQALALILERADIAVVITDLRMANLDGLSLIRQARAALPADRDVAFMILTGDASTQLDADVADIPVFVKPAETDQLVLAIEEALARL